jgi:hypothetical protein
MEGFAVLGDDDKGDVTGHSRGGNVAKDRVNRVPRLNEAEKTFPCFLFFALALCQFLCGRIFGVHAFFLCVGVVLCFYDRLWNQCLCGPVGFHVVNIAHPHNHCKRKEKNLL